MTNGTESNEGESARTGGSSVHRLEQSTRGADIDHLATHRALGKLHAILGQRARLVGENPLDETELVVEIRRLWAHATVGRRHLVVPAFSLLRRRIRVEPFCVCVSCLARLTNT